MKSYIFLSVILILTKYFAISVPIGSDGSIDETMLQRVESNMTETVSVKPGSNIIFHCKPKNSYEFSSSWFKDGKMINYDQRISYTGYAMVINNITKSDSGLYACYVNVSNPRYMEIIEVKLDVETTWDTIWDLSSVIIPQLSMCLNAFLGWYHMRKYWRFVSQSRKLQKSLYKHCRRRIWRRNLKIGCKIGFGHYGEVLEGMYKGKKVAVKMLKNQLDKDQNNSLKIEHKILTKLKHPNIINVIGACVSKLSELCVVVEYCENGNLKDYLLKLQSIITDSNPVNKKLLFEFGIGICSGMEYLGSHNIIHRDLAARNVLLTLDRVIKLCDFGLARNLYFSDEYKMQSDMALPLKWMAIESIVHKLFTTKSDIWSFGVCCWEIFSLGDEPYRGLDSKPSIVVQNLIVNGFRLDRPGYCPDDIFLAMKHCWNTDPDMRPTFPQLIDIFNHSINGHGDITESVDQSVPNNDQPPAASATLSAYDPRALMVAAGLK